MKTKLILGSLLAFAGIAQAQWDVSSTTNATSSNIGIGGSPTDRLEVVSTNNDGITIKQTTYGAANLSLNNTQTGGHRYVLGSLGPANPAGTGNFSIYDNNSAIDRFLISGSTGNVGIGTTSPTERLTLVTSVSNGGMRITQQTIGGCMLHLENQSSGGRDWGFASYGTSNTQGAGNLGIFDFTTGSDRLFINGASGNVGIGLITPNNARLEVKQDGQSSYNRALYATALRTTGTAATNIGMEGRGGGSGQCVNGTSYGVIGRAYNSILNYGGWFESYNDQNCSPVLSVGVYGSGLTHAGYFAGNVEYTGTLITPSDRKLKDNITPLVNALDKIKLLKPSLYTYKVGEFKDMHLPEGSQMGLIAQELEQVFPDLVKHTAEISHKDENGEVVTSIPEHKSVNYLSLIPLLIAGAQEQQATIESQQKQLDEQKQLIDALTQKASGITGINSLGNVETGFQMAQNEPNPFTNETVVKYTLPQTINTAFMAVYDLSGKQITSFPITEKGSSSITITSEKLAAGIYIYSIVADGKVIDSKRMIVAEK